MSQALDLLRQLVAVHNPKAYAEPGVQRTWEAARQLVASHDAPDCTEPAQVEREQESRTDTAGSENVQENEGGSEMEGCSKMPRFKVGDRVWHAGKPGTVGRLDYGCGGSTEVWVNWDDGARSTWFDDDDQRDFLAELEMDAESTGEADARGWARKFTTAEVLAATRAERDEARAEVVDGEILNRSLVVSLKYSNDQLRLAAAENTRLDRENARLIADGKRLTAELAQVREANKAAVTTLLDENLALCGEPSPVLDALRDALPTFRAVWLAESIDKRGDVAIEEMSELTKELMHHRRGRLLGNETIQEETGDVLLSVLALAIRAGEESVAEWICAKVARLADRLDGGK